MLDFDNFNYGGSGGGNDYSYGGTGGGNQDFSYNQGGDTNMGGGWMNSGGGGDDDSKVRGGYKNQTLRPVTIKQLVEVPITTGDMPVHIDGEEIKQVKFVGIVRNIVQQSVNVTYSVEDGTGKIDVRMWINGESGEEGARDQMLDPSIAIGKYVRVYGELKFFNNTRSVTAHKIRAITDHNEITCHGLEATYVHLCKTRGPKSASAVSAPYSANGARMGMDDGMTPVRSAILDAIKNAPPNPEGVNIANIQQSLAGRFQRDEIATAADWLINEGHLFTTIDEHHLQATNAFA
ncbi:Replication factor A protein 2 [Coemansia sp. RSA 2131]|nr:Replication factor A protein 2 [Coemansia sp. RSA 2131]